MALRLIEGHRVAKPEGQHFTADPCHNHKDQGQVTASNF